MSIDRTLTLQDKLNAYHAAAAIAKATGNNPARFYWQAKLIRDALDAAAWAVENAKPKKTAPEKLTNVVVPRENIIRKPLRKSGKKRKL